MTLQPNRFGATDFQIQADTNLKIGRAAFEKSFFSVACEARSASRDAEKIFCQTVNDTRGEHV